MDQLNSDLILHIAQYVSVLDAAAWMQTSRRYYYLIHQLRHVLGPEMVAAASATPVETALGKLRQSPTLALCCNTLTSTFAEQVATQLPPDTVVLGAVGHDIQTCLEGQEVECTSPANILLGHLGHEASIQPFCWQSHTGRHGMQWEGQIQQEVVEAFPSNSTTKYEVFIIYCCGAGYQVVEDFIQCVQSRHPHAALVGGICSFGYVSTKVDTTNDMTPGRLSSKRVAVLKQMYRNLGGSNSILETLTEKQTLVEHVYELLQQRPYVLEPHLGDAVFGVALGGNVPVRSVVSRGVKRLTPPNTLLLVQEARLVGPFVSHDWQQHQLFQQAPPGAQSSLTVVPPFHVIESICEDPNADGVDKNNSNSNRSSNTMKSEWDLHSFLAHCSQQGDSVEFCGVRRRRKRCTHGNDASNNESMQMNDADENEDAFELYPIDFHGNKIRIPVANTVLDNNGSPTTQTGSSSLLSQLQTTTTAHEEGALNQAQIDFFSLDGEACKDHVENTMKQLKEQTQNNNDNVMAAMMFSCNGRGPSPGWLIDERMADATNFARAFGGEVPCIGFYAGGEIGPLATAAPPAVASSNNKARNIFQRGKAALQGFTAVFALFIAPKVDLSRLEIDDSPEHVSQFIRNHLLARELPN
jgi:small ligand-binding sensory domain FIST